MNSEFPGILIVETIEGPTVYVSDQNGEIGRWSHKDVISDPTKLNFCLNAVMYAAKYGPSSARQYLEDCRIEDPTLPHDSKIACNVCNCEFNIKNSKFRNVFIVGDRTIVEYQCSEDCYVRRQVDFESHKSRNGFVEKLQEIFRKT